MIKILLADDHPLLLNGTKLFLEELGHHVVETCSNGQVAYAMLKIKFPNIVILDINMPGMDGLELAAKIQSENLRIKVILLTMHNEIEVYEKAIDLGVLGYVLKDQAEHELEACIESVMRNEVFLSAHLKANTRSSYFMSEDLNLTLIENKIVQFISLQKTTKEIADLLFISPKTVEAHRSRIIEKLDLPKEKNSLLKWAIQNADLLQ